MGKVLVVETGLADEVAYRGKSFTRHARTRFVDRPAPALPEPPKLGDPWCPLTVRARLERMGETYRRLPHSPDTRPAGHKSCMPTPLRELFKDMPAAPLRQGVSDADLAAANQVIDVLTKDERAIAWAIANRMKDTELGLREGCDRRTAAAKKQRVLGHLAAHWNAMDWKPDEEDVRRANRFLHRNID